MGLIFFQFSYTGATTIPTSGGGGSPSDWILDGGSWDDTGVWDDSRVWID